MSTHKLIEIIGPPGSGKTFIGLELEKSKNGEEQIFFHSGSSKNFLTNTELSFLNKIIIKSKVILIIVIFYLIFYKRLFIKKVYKREFFFRSILIFYRNLISIEFLKKKLGKQQYLITEPGLIMHFLQDYFYSNEIISEKDVKIFNKFFLKTNNIIYLNSSSDLLIKRLDSRKRGLPQRMINLSQKEINETINKSINVINDYISLSSNSKIRTIKIDATKDISTIKSKIISLLGENYEL